MAAVGVFNHHHAGIDYHYQILDHRTPSQPLLVVPKNYVDDYCAYSSITVFSGQISGGGRWQYHSQTTHELSFSFFCLKEARSFSSFSTFDGLTLTFDHSSHDYHTLLHHHSSLYFSFSPLHTWRGSAYVDRLTIVYYYHLSSIQVTS